MKNTLYAFITSILLLSACTGSGRKDKIEQIKPELDGDSVAMNDTMANGLMEMKSMSEISTFPHTVLLTGMQRFRLVPVYKSVRDKEATLSISKTRYDSYEANEEGMSDEHFMPGIDILYGYNLLNIAHYDFQTLKTRFLFDHPVLVKTLYYPCFEQDSLNGQPVNRNYYLVSAYDSDTNKDTLLNKNDLRHFFLINDSANHKMEVIPSDYSVVRSEYDPGNDFMYIFAKQDENKDGTISKSESTRVFYLNLKNPGPAIRMY